MESAVHPEMCAPADLPRRHRVEPRVPRSQTTARPRMDVHEWTIDPRVSQRVHGEFPLLDTPLRVLRQKCPLNGIVLFNACSSNKVRARAECTAQVSENRSLPPRGATQSPQLSNRMALGDDRAPLHQDVRD